MAALAQWTNVGMIDNSVNEMEVHIQQTNDRLQCIRQVGSTHGNSTLHCVPKKHLLHFQLYLENQLSNFNNFLAQIFLTQLAIKLPFSFPPHLMYASALPRESRSTKICIKINRKPEKNIPNIIDRTLNKN